MKTKSKTYHEVFVHNAIGDNKYLEITYNNGKGHFKIWLDTVIDNMTITEFRKVVSMIEISEDPQMLAGYLNYIIKSAYNDCARCKEVDSDKQVNYKDDYPLIMESWDYSLNYLAKRNNELVKKFGVSPVIEDTKPEVPEVQETEVQENIKSNELITELKRCNVNRLIPTSIKPFTGTITTKIGYSLEYRGMPLQIITDKGWIKNDIQCRIEIIDPVLGLPITSFDGTLSELENKLSEVFIGYLKTIESNKENVVQIARTFQKLKSA